MKIKEIKNILKIFKITLKNILTFIFLYDIINYKIKTKKERGYLIMAQTIFKIELSEEEKEVLKKATSILEDIRDTFPNTCEEGIQDSYLSNTKDIDNLLDVCTSYPFRN